MGSFMAARGIISTFFASNFIVPAQVPPFSREETQLGSGEKVAFSLSARRLPRNLHALGSVGQRKRKLFSADQ